MWGIPKKLVLCSVLYSSSNYCSVVCEVLEWSSKLLVGVEPSWSPLLYSVYRWM